MAEKHKISVEEINLALNPIRTHIINDGGDIRVVEIIDDNEIIVKWLGSCATCDKKELAFKYSIKDYLKEKFPQITNITQI